MKFTQILNISLIIFFINGCSFLSSFARENPNERYKEEGEDLVTNSETENLEISNDYPYPSIQNNPLSQSELPRPKKIFSSGNSEKVEIRRLGEIYWIYIEALPSKMWALTKDLLAAQYDIENEDPTSGKIKAKSKANGEDINIILEHGIRNNSSEIYLEDDSGAAVDVGFYNSFSNYFVENLPGYQGNSLAAQSLNLNKKTRIVYVQKEIGIEFKLTFERTWSAISRALERSSLEIKDRNRELKYFQVSVDEDDNSFFGFFSRSNNAADVDYELTFTQSGENTILEFKKLSNTSISVNDLVDQINENLS